MHLRLSFDSKSGIQDHLKNMVNKVTRSVRFLSGTAVIITIYKPIISSHLDYGYIDFSHQMMETTQYMFAIAKKKRASSGTSRPKLYYRLSWKMIKETLLVI